MVVVDGTKYLAAGTVVRCGKRYMTNDRIDPPLTAEEWEMIRAAKKKRQNRTTEIRDSHVHDVVEEEGVATGQH